MSATHDKTGKPYAKLSETSAGDHLIADGGFDCLAAGRRVLVEADDLGLFVACTKGRVHHYLDGQADDGEHMVGLYRAEAA